MSRQYARALWRDGERKRWFAHLACHVIEDPRCANGNPVHHGNKSGELVQKAPETLEPRVRPPQVIWSSPALGSQLNGELEGTRTYLLSMSERLSALEAEDPGSRAKIEQARAILSHADSLAAHQEADTLLAEAEATVVSP